MTKDWKEEFDRLYSFIDEDTVYTVKQFIESNFVPKLEHQTKLALARANAMQTRTATLGEVIMMVEKKMMKERNLGDGADESWNKGVFYHNGALKKIIKELRSTK